MEDIKELDLFSREKALGREAHEHLLELEGDKEGLKKLRGEYIPRMCLHCGKKSTDKNFRGKHKCGGKNIIDGTKIPKPEHIGRKIMIPIKFHNKIFKFEHNKSAELFIRLVYKEKLTIRDAIKDKRLDWFWNSKPYYKEEDKDE